MGIKPMPKADLANLFGMMRKINENTKKIRDFTDQELKDSDKYEKAYSMLNAGIMSIQATQMPLKYAIATVLRLLGAAYCTNIRIGDAQDFFKRPERPELRVINNPDKPKLLN